MVESKRNIAKLIGVAEEILFSPPTKDFPDIASVDILTETLISNDPLLFYVIKLFPHEKLHHIKLGVSSRGGFERSKDWKVLYNNSEVLREYPCDSVTDEKTLIKKMAIGEKPLSGECFEVKNLPSFLQRADCIMLGYGVKARSHLVNLR